MKKYILIFLLILVLSILQTTFLNFNFLFVFILVLSLIFSIQSSLFLAFSAGLIFDLFFGGQFGLTALGLVLSVVFFTLFRLNFSIQNPFFCFLISFVLFLLFSFLTINNFAWIQGLFIAGLIVTFHLLTRQTLKVYQ